MKKYLFLIILLISIKYIAIAQPSAPALLPTELPKHGTVKGKIIDSSVSMPMEFTSVALFNSNDSTLVTGTISTNDGTFVLREIPFGNYFLVANFMGYEKTFVNTIKLNEDNPLFDAGTVKLAPAAQNLDEVEVIATQNRVDYKIDRKIINVSQDLNAAGGSAAEVLQNTPSVTVDIDGNVSLRGSTNFTVLIDGRPTPLSGNDALQQIPATSIQHIEIITNPSAKFDPDGMAGIINIVMKKNSLQGLSGIFNTSVGTGQKYSGDFLLNYKTNKFNVFGGVDYQNNRFGGSMNSLREMSPDAPVSSLILIDGSRDMFRNGLVLKTGMDYYLSANSTLSLGVDIGNRGFSSEMNTKMHSYTFPATTDTFYRANGNSTRGGNYYNLNLNYSKKFAGDRHELIALFSYQGQKSDDTEEENEFPADENYQILPLPVIKVRSSELGSESEFRAKIDYTKPLFQKGFLETGYQMRLDYETEDYLFEDYDPDTDNWSDNLLYSSGNYFDRNIQAAYATFSNSLGQFEYKLGLRGEYTHRNIRREKNGDPFTLDRLDYFPSLHLSRQLKNEQQLLASYSRRINRPNGWDLEPFRSYMNSYSLREGNPQLKPEYVNSVELSYQKNIGKSFFVIESYYRNTQNLITRVMYRDESLPDMVIMTSENLNDDHSAGAEFMLNLAAAKWLNVNTSVNVYRYWLNGTLYGESISRESNNWDLRLNSSFFLSPKSRIQANVMYNGPSVTAQGNREAFYFVNLAFRQDFLDRKLSATLSVQDILGTMRHEFSTFTPTLNNTVRFEREHQVITLTLSYKLNNFKNQNRKNDDSQIMLEEGGGGF